MLACRPYPLIFLCFEKYRYLTPSFERPAVQRLLDLVQKGVVRCIIVKDFSRFGRNSIEVEYYLERVFPLYSVRFISVNDGYDNAQLNGDTGGLNIAFKYLIAELYSRDLSTKYKSAKFAKFRRGEYQSKICPYS
jgi:DNA invertase Pin-like site-specific DNA recombinase